MTTTRDPRVRPAGPGDVPEILAMIRELAVYEREPDAVEATEDGLRAALFGDQPVVFAHVAHEEGAHEEGAHEEGAQQEGRLVGMALWFRSFSTWTGRPGLYLEDLFIRPAARGQGLGRALLGTLAAVCAEQGWPRMEWSVLDWNERALGFYRSLGAVGMDGWTVHRATGEALARLARPAPAPGLETAPGAA